MAETRKAHERRLREGFYEAFCQGHGLDVGGGRDPIALSMPELDVDVWDKEQGDATYLAAIPHMNLDWIYASHILEHLHNPFLALINWGEKIAWGGHLIIAVPHRDLYEKRRELPSRWNEEHKTFWLPEHHATPHTLGLRATVEVALPHFEIIYCKVLDEGWHPVPEHVHSGGEYSIELVARAPR